MRGKSKWLTVVMIFAMSVLVTGCSSSDIPDKYNYDDLSEYLTLGQYKKIQYEPYDTNVTQAEVMEYIYSEMNQNVAEKRVKDGTIENDSIVVIDYEGRIDGKLVDGAVASDVTVDMSNNNYLPEFTAGMLGKNVGEKFTISFSFPEDYTPELAGKPVVFTINAKYLVTKETPEYNDKYVKENTNYNSTDAYEKAVKKILADTQKEKASEYAKMQIYDIIDKDSTVKKYPEKEYDEKYNLIVDSYKKLAEDSDKEFNAYLQSEMGVTETEFYKQAEEMAKASVKQELIIYSIARKEDITVDKKEYNEYLDNLIEEAGYTRKSFKKESGMSIDEYAETNNFYMSLIYSKVMDKVLEYSIAK